MEPTVHAEVQIRVNGTWYRLGGPYDSVTSAVIFRRGMIEGASRSNGPDASQYVRAHTRVAEVTTVTEIEVITG